ncbi:ash family protein [Salmonella enterica]
MHFVVPSGYSKFVVANSTTGLDLPNTVPVPKHAPKACFLLPDAPCSMAVRAGASTDAPGSDTAGKVNPVRTATSQIDLCSGSEKILYRRLPSWLRPQQKNTQNPRSATRTPFPSSATTVAVRFTVRRWWRYIFPQTYRNVICVRPRSGYRSFLPAFVMILRI